MTTRYYLKFIRFTIFLMICLLPISAYAISIIKWDPNWHVTGPNVNLSHYDGSRPVSGHASWAPLFLKAHAYSDIIPFEPSSYDSENATTEITISNYFTVEGSPEENGKEVDGYLCGSLNGILSAFGISLGNATGNYSSSISASVDAGFAKWSDNPSLAGSMLVLGLSDKAINSPFSVRGRLKIGTRYPFDMSLTVGVTKFGVYSVSSMVYGFSAIVGIGTAPSAPTYTPSAPSILPSIPPIQ